MLSERELFRTLSAEASKARAVCYLAAAGVAHHVACPTPSDCKQFLFFDDPRCTLCRRGILDHGVYLQFEHVRPLSNMLSNGSESVCSASPSLWREIS